MTPELLRETKPVSGNGAVTAKRRFDPTRIFVEKDRLAWFWFVFAMVVLVASAVDRIVLTSALKRQERVIVVDPASTYYVSPILKFQEAKDLHEQQSTLAALAFLERSPQGFDNDELVKQMFLKTASEKAMAQRASEEAEFKAKQLHQKVEIGRIDILTTREDVVLTQVTGQLVRTGIFQDKTFSEALPFKLSLKLLRNPNMVLNGRFPMAVSDFKYEMSH